MLLAVVMLAVVAGGTTAVSTIIAFRYYDENKTFIGTSRNGSHTYVRIILCVKGANSQVDLAMASGSIALPDNIAEGWEITINGVKFLLKNND
jgi:hypothetical protein